MKTALRHTLIGLLLVLTLCPPSFASEAPTPAGETPVSESSTSDAPVSEASISVAIVDFLNTSSFELPTEAAFSAESDPVVSLMSIVVEAVVNSDAQSLSNSIDAIANNDVPLDVSDAPILNFAQDTLALLETISPEARSERLLEHFSKFSAGNNWYTASVASSLSAFLYASRGELIVAGQQIDLAMDRIPSELSARATIARLHASEAAMILHGVQGNPAFMLDAAKVLGQAKTDLGQTMNRHELITNFIFVLNRTRDFEGAARVAALLDNQEAPETVIAGLAEVYAAQTHNELAEYGLARTFADAALTLSDHRAVTTRAQYELSVAYAGLDMSQEARALMSSNGWDYDQDTLLSTVNEEAVLHAAALLARNDGKTSDALALMKRRTDLLVARVQTANSSNMSKMLSNLENTRERQLEREGALQREAELKAVQLEQKNRLNKLLWVLIALLTVAFNMLLAFLRYREKNNRKVRALQEDALSAEKMKTEFLGLINHELRTPLNGIIGISDAMIHHAADPVMREQAEAVQESGQLLHDLLDSLITMSTIEGNRLELDSDPTRLATAISREVAEWEPAAAKKGIAFTHFIGSSLSDLVEADAKRLRQCLRFLLSNAVRFTHEGRVHLHATSETDSETGHLQLSIVVADTGQGMREEVQDRLFKPFLQADAAMTRKYGGAGLSLAIARKIARMMGGDLTVNSREDRGSEFTFTARFAPATAIAPIRKAPILAQTAMTVPTIRSVQTDHTSTDVSLPQIDLNAVDDPEAIIDMMLEQQLFDAEPDEPDDLKAAG